MSRKVSPWLVASVGVGVSLAGFFLYRAFTSPTPASATTDASGKPLTPCDRAAQLAAVAATSTDPHAEQGPYETWANLCRQSGGSPPPFPGA
jgi:hypothetical protein